MLNSALRPSQPSFESLALGSSGLAVGDGASKQENHECMSIVDHGQFREVVEDRENRS
jgi:hypothetical protein